MIRQISAVLIALLFASIASAHNYGDKGFEAAAASIKSKDNLIVVLTGDYCSPCAQLKEMIKVADSMGLIKGFNLVVVDYQSDFGKRVSKQNVIPQIHRYSYSNDEWTRTNLVGFHNQSKFLEYCRGKN